VLLVGGGGRSGSIVGVGGRGLRQRCGTGRAVRTDRLEARRAHLQRQKNVGQKADQIPILNAEQLNQTSARPAAPLATGVTKISSVNMTDKNWLP